MHFNLLWHLYNKIIKKLINEEPNKLGSQAFLVTISTKCIRNLIIKLVRHIRIHSHVELIKSSMVIVLGLDTILGSMCDTSDAESFHVTIA